MNQSKNIVNCGISEFKRSHGKDLLDGKPVIVTTYGRPSALITPLDDHSRAVLEEQEWLPRIRFRDLYLWFPKQLEMLEKQGSLKALITWHHVGVALLTVLQDDTIGTIENRIDLARQDAVAGLMGWSETPTLHHSIKMRPTGKLLVTCPHPRNSDTCGVLEPNKGHKANACAYDGSGKDGCSKEVPGYSTTSGCLLDEFVNIQSVSLSEMGIDEASLEVGKSVSLALTWEGEGLEVFPHLRILEDDK